MKIFFSSVFLVFSFFSLNGLTISQSGIFTLGGDINESGQVIYVLVSNVTIDLGGYTISGGTNGIVI